MCTVSNCDKFYLIFDKYSSQFAKKPLSFTPARRIYDRILILVPSNVDIIHIACGEYIRYNYQSNYSPKVHFVNNFLMFVGLAAYWGDSRAILNQFFPPPTSGPSPQFAWQSSPSLSEIFDLPGNSSDPCLP